MSGRSAKRPGVTVADLCEAMERIAPRGLAQGWDNVGLLAGDPGDAVRRVLLCIDLTPRVVDEAVRRKAGLVVAYHPPIFKPIASLRADSRGTDSAVYRCVRHGIAVYSVHTALDAAEGGTNDVIASLLGMSATEPLEYVNQPGRSEYKLVVFVPEGEVEKVSAAMFGAGAGHIGDYSRCSFRIPGEGTFFGGETTRPTVGQRGRTEHVSEARLETVVGTDRLAAVVAAMVHAHSYEEPAYDVYPLTPPPVRGIGRHGSLPRPTTLGGVARKLKRATGAVRVQIVGDRDATVRQAVIVVGAAGSLPFRLPLTSDYVIITGEIRHHDALAIECIGCTAVALGHWTSERPGLASLAHGMGDALPSLAIHLSDSDHEPFGFI